MMSDHASEIRLDLSRDNLELSVDEMEGTRVARFKDLDFIWDQYLDTRISGYSRSQANIVAGFNEHKELEPAIASDDGVLTSLMRIPPDGRVAPHNHRTVEILLTIEGNLTIMWGLNGDSADGLHELEIGPLDTISIPPGLFRTFHNRGPRDALVLFTISTCSQPAPVYWPEWVERKAREAGWVLDEAGVMKEVASAARRK